MRYQLDFTNQYLRDLRLARKQGLDEAKLNAVLLKLIDGGPLPLRNRDHALTGNYKGLRECHIAPDWLLIYSADKAIKLITLIRTGSHSQLFGK